MINANITRDKIEGSLIVHAFIYINSTMGVCMCMHEKEGGTMKNVMFICLLLLSVVMFQGISMNQNL